MCDRGCLGDLVDADFVASGKDCLDNLLCPVSAVAKQAEVAKRFLWAAQLSFTLAKQVGKLNHESPVTVPLMLGQRQDTRHVVVFGRLFFLGEVRY